MGRKIVTAVLLLLLLISITGCGEKNIDKVSEIGTTELVHYVGESISVLEEKLDVKFAVSPNNSYLLNQRDKSGNMITLFECTTNENGNVVKVQLINSGETGYTLCGILSSMDKETAQNILRDNDMSLVSENIWKCPNDKDVVIFSSLQFK